MVLSRFTTVLLAALVGSSLIATPAQADPREEAKALADSAYNLLQKGLYAEAVELFRRADARFHSPVFVLYMAEGEEKRGRLLEARRLLESVRDEPLSEEAPETFRQAHDEAVARLAALELRIPTLTIEVRAPAPAAVTLDGEPVASLGAPIAVDPGTHEVVAELDGIHERRSLEIGVRERVEVVIELAGAPPEAAGEALPSWVWPAVGYGVGGVGLVMGVVAGGMFVSRQGDLKDACAAGDPERCPPEQADEIEAVQTLGDVATAGWILAVAGAAAGTVLLFVIDDEEAGAGAEARLGPGGLIVRGRF